MKKQLKKLSLNKRTIANLNAGEMKMKMGGGRTQNGKKCQNLSLPPVCNTGPDPTWDFDCV